MVHAICPLCAPNLIIAIDTDADDGSQVESPNLSTSIINDGRDQTQKSPEKTPNKSRSKDTEGKYISEQMDDGKDDLPDVDDFFETNFELLQVQCLIY